MIFKKKNKNENNKIVEIAEIAERLRKRDESVTVEEINKVALHMYNKSKKFTNKFRAFNILIIPIFMFQIITTNIKPILFLSMFMLIFIGYQLGICNKWDYIDKKFLKNIKDINKFIKQERSIEEVK